MERVTEATIEFTDIYGRSVGYLTVIPLNDKNLYKTPSLLQLTQYEAYESGQEAVQLLEGMTYEYELSGVGQGVQLRENQLVTRSKLPSVRGERGLIRPGLYTGRLPLELVDQHGRIVGTSALEVRSVKLTYQTDYQEMINYISSKCTDLLLELRSPSQVRLSPDPGRDPETMAQRYFFVKSIITSHEFHDALERILALPHVQWGAVEREMDVSRGFRPNSSSLRQLVARRPRRPVPQTSVVYGRLDSLPVRITVLDHVETVDSPENRFVKYVVISFRDFLERMSNQLDRRSDSKIYEDVMSMIEQLSEILSRPFFRDVTDLSIVPYSSPVLQRKSGYRDIFEAWLKFDLAARLVWHGGLDVYGGGKRDVARLYEYWVFFVLLDFVEKRFNLTVPPIEELIEETPDGFGVRLKAGNKLEFEGQCVTNGRAMKVVFSYNRTFPRTGSNEGTNYPSAGSWTRPMRPDYSFSFWPIEMSQEEAERQELIVHIHFDAKYRIDSIEGLFGAEDTDLEEEKEAQRGSGAYKRADLLKMHAYKDAIRRTQGAYVIYPGSEDVKWKSYHEILPSLGAFALRPGNEEQGMDQLSSFFDDVLAHLSDRATRREEYSYYTFKVHERPSPYRVMLPIPETERNLRVVPPSSHIVIVSDYIDLAHLENIRSSMRYYCKVSKSSFSHRINTEIFSAKHLLLLGRTEHVSRGLWRIHGDQPRLVIGRQIPGHSSDDEDFYVEFNIDYDSGFEKLQWDGDLLRSVGEMPYVLSLSQLVEMCAEMVQG